MTRIAGRLAEVVPLGGSSRYQDARSLVLGDVLQPSERASPIRASLTSPGVHELQFQ